MIEIEFLRQAQFSFDGSNVKSVVAGQKAKSESPQSEKILRNFVESGWAKVISESKADTQKKSTRVRTPKQSK